MYFFFYIYFFGFPINDMKILFVQKISRTYNILKIIKGDIFIYDHMTS